MTCPLCKKRTKKTFEVPKWWHVYQTFYCKHDDKYFIVEIGSTTDVEGITSGSGSIYQISKTEHDEIVNSKVIPPQTNRDGWNYLKSETYHYDV